MFSSLVQAKKQDIAQVNLYEKRRLQYLHFNEDPKDTKTPFPTKALTREPAFTNTHSKFETDPNPNLLCTNASPRHRKKQCIKATGKERMRFAQKRIKYLTGNQMTKSKHGTKTKIMVGPDLGLAWHNEGGSGPKYCQKKKINPRKLHKYLSQMAKPLKKCKNNSTRELVKQD